MAAEIGDGSARVVASYVGFSVFFAPPTGDVWADIAILDCSVSASSFECYLNDVSTKNLTSQASNM